MEDKSAADLEICTGHTLWIIPSQGNDWCCIMEKMVKLSHCADAITQNKAVSS